MLAVQGPTARELLATVNAEAAVVPRFAVARVGELVVAGTGYTGEDGVELHVAAADAPALWDALVAAGIEPAGLGARDTLRLEAGLPLHGHELGAGITPLQAGLGWVVGWDKADFRGRAALAAERERGIARRLRGIDGRRPAPAAGRVAGTRRRRADRRRDQRQLLADARARHRARVRPADFGGGRRRCRSTSAGSCSTAEWYRCRS